MEENLEWVAEFNDKDEAYDDSELLLSLTWCLDDATLSKSPGVSLDTVSLDRLLSRKCARP